MPEYLKISKGGDLWPVGPRAESYLAGRPGDWRIIPSHPDLLLLRRDAIQPSPEGVRAVLAGDVEGQPIGEILGYLAQSRTTGVLTMATSTVEKSIFLREGSVCWASSTALNDRLGVVLGRLGLVEPGQIDAILATQPNAGGRLGALLLEGGLVTPADLYSALKHQVQEIFFSIIVLKEGLYFLFNDAVEGRFAAKINLDLNGLLMEGLRRYDEMEHFRDRVPGMQVYVRARDRASEGLNEQECALFAAASGRETLAELAAKLHLTDFEATGMVYGLMKAGYVDLTDEQPEVALGQATVAVDAELNDIARVFNTIFREIYDEIGAVAPTAGFRLGVESFLGSKQHNFGKLLAGLDMGEDGMLDEEALLQRIATLEFENESARASFFSEALNELMFFELFQAGEILLPDRDEDLSRRVRVIYEMLDS